MLSAALVTLAAAGSICLHVNHKILSVCKRTAYINDVTDAGPFGFASISSLVARGTIMLPMCDGSAIVSHRSYSSMVSL